MSSRWSRPETWWCVEVETPIRAARRIGLRRAWQDVLDRAAAVKRLGDIDVPGFTGLFRIRAGREADRFYLVCEHQEGETRQSGGGDGPRFQREPGPPDAG